MEQTLSPRVPYKCVIKRYRKDVICDYLGEGETHLFPSFATVNLLMPNGKLITRKFGDIVETVNIAGDVISNFTCIKRTFCNYLQRERDPVQLDQSMYDTLAQEARAHYGI